MKNALRLFLATLAAGLVLAGCGGGSSDSGTSDQAPAAAGNGVATRSAVAFDPGRIYRDSIDGVVSIRTVFDRGETGPLGPRAAGGSGFVLNDDGDLITNAHVVSEETGDGWEPVERVYVEFGSGDILPARVIGVDRFSDVALLRVDPAKVELAPLELGNSSRVTVGEPVAVIGSPFGEDQTLTTGVVSQVGRSVTSLTDFEIQDAIQTDASINPGNSGGPMLDSRGRVIAISQQMKTGSGASDGVGFGVPANTIRRSADQIRETGGVSYAYIGVSTEPLYPQLAEKLGLDVERGATVVQVLPGGPAARAGLKAGSRQIEFQGNRFTVGGDVIFKVDGIPANDPEELGRIIARKEPGDTVEVEVLRDGSKKTIKVELTERPERVAPR
ncbi:MAG: trypsin-like peptidase domain-containing protein [Solirubrobacterales bacterium]|nr:trypsin-like peptidase domain-containing protein [Solirubrobacterales bacterium]